MARGERNVGCPNRCHHRASREPLPLLLLLLLLLELLLQLLLLLGVCCCCCCQAASCCCVMGSDEGGEGFPASSPTRGEGGKDRME